MPSPHGGHTFDGVAGLPPRVRGDAAFQSPAAGLSAHTGIHLIDDHAYTSRDTFLSAHKDSSLPTVNSRFQRALSPRPRGFIPSVPEPVHPHQPFSTRTGIRQPAAASHLGNVPFSTRTGIRAGTAREGSEPFLPQHTDTYSVAEAHGQAGSPFSAHMQSVSRLVHRSTFLIFPPRMGRCVVQRSCLWLFHACARAMTGFPPPIAGPSPAHMRGLCRHTDERSIPRPVLAFPACMDGGMCLRGMPPSMPFRVGFPKKETPAILLGSMACLSASRQKKRGKRGDGTRRHRAAGARSVKRSRDDHGTLLFFKLLLAGHAVPHRRRGQEPQERYGLPTRLADAVIHDLYAPQGIFQIPDALDTPGCQPLIHRVLAQARGQFVFIGAFEGNLRGHVGRPQCRKFPFHHPSQCSQLGGVHNVPHLRGLFRGPDVSPTTRRLHDAPMAFLCNALKPLEAVPPASLPCPSAFFPMNPPAQRPQGQNPQPFGKLEKDFPQLLDACRQPRGPGLHEFLPRAVAVQYAYVGKPGLARACNVILPVAHHDRA